jgi:hypothetical protein
MKPLWRAILDLVTDNNDIVKRAKSVGINVSKITQEILTAVKSVQGLEEGICTDAVVERKKRVLIEKVHQVMEQYGIDGTDIEVGSYLDPYVLNAYIETRSMLAPYYYLDEHFHDCRGAPNKFDAYCLYNSHHVKRILYNLLAKLVEVTEKNHAQILGIESAFDFDDED